MLDLAPMKVALDFPRSFRMTSNESSPLVLHCFPVSFALFSYLSFVSNSGRIRGQKVRQGLHSRQKKFDHETAKFGTAIRAASTYSTATLARRYKSIWYSLKDGRTHESPYVAVAQN